MGRNPNPILLNYYIQFTSFLIIVLHFYNEMIDFLIDSQIMSMSFAII